METLDFNFTADPQNRFDCVDADGNPLVIVLDRANGLLRVTRQDHVLGEFPLTQDEEPHPQAVYLRRVADSTPVLEFGSVDFLDQAEYLEDYPLNDLEIVDEWKLDLVDGGIVILDIRNLGRQISTVYSLDLVPVVLSITGIYLRVATLKYPASSGLTPWYRQESRPRP
jgi:hypothetical protein